MTGKSSDTLYKRDACFYDLDNRPALSEDIPFYVEYAAKIGGPVLELACGTGRITIPLAGAGHEVWALEYSEAMIDVFKDKLKKMPGEIKDKIHLFQGDMSDLKIRRRFPLILLPARSFQLLLDETKENDCLQGVYTHLEEGGHFIMAIANYTKSITDHWTNKEETFDWENIDPRTGYKIRRTHIKKKIDREKQILYPRKIYRIIKDDGSTEKVVKQAAWKYFSEEQVKSLLVSNGFEIVKEMGYFDGRPIREGTEFIFVCRKKQAPDR